MFAVERYGATPASEVGRSADRQTGSGGGKRARAEHVGRRSRAAAAAAATEAEADTERSASRVDWRAVKRQKRPKRWAAELEAQMDAGAATETVAKTAVTGSAAAVEKEAAAGEEEATTATVEETPQALAPQAAARATPGATALVANTAAQTAAKAAAAKTAVAGLPAWLARPVVVQAAAAAADADAFAVAHARFALSPHARARLAALGITRLFPVQAAVLPRLLAARFASAPRAPPSDLLVASPTGSGKTLAYCLPIVDFLLAPDSSAAAATDAVAAAATAHASGRIIARLRALVVVPTRDLAVQVKSTFDQITKGCAVRVGVVTGSMSFNAEQEMLVESSGRDVGTEGPNTSSKIDILIATPGRLTDHLKGTPGFSLRHLRFLVLDEADRLLVQDYQGWLNLVLKGVKGDHLLGDPVADDEAIISHSKARYDKYLSGGCCDDLFKEKSVVDADGGKWRHLGFKVDELGMPLHNAVSLRQEQIQLLDNDIELRSKNTSCTIHHHVPLQKLLFSATLTRNPEKIASLQLVNPVFIAVSSSLSTPQSILAEHTEINESNTEAFDVTDHQISGANGDDAIDIDKFHAPSTLTEHMIVVKSTADKPLVLMHLLFTKRLAGVLVFTRSVESAHRLATLIEATGAALGNAAPTPVPAVRAITSDLSTAARRRIVAGFVAGRFAVLVCSDVMARGMDLGQSVAAVVNYDAPRSVAAAAAGAGGADSAAGAAKTYVHRVGRTARAGCAGDAWSIVEEKEARWFKRDVVGMVRRAEGRTVVRVKVGDADVDALRPAYESALQKLAAMVKGKLREHE